VRAVGGVTVTDGRGGRGGRAGHSADGLAADASVRDAPDYEQIVLDLTDRVLTITLNRPDRLNAFTHTMMNELIDAFDRADADDEVRVVIVTGAGRGFCAGADLGAGGDTFDHGGETADFRDGGGRVALRIFASTKPVIAAINGPAVGVGATMTLPMDIRIASTDARIGFVFARRGIVPEAASSWFLPRVVGISTAMEWVSTGRIMPAQEAREGGMLRSVHAPGQLIRAARELAAEIVDNTSAISVAMARQMMWRMLGADHPMEAHQLDSRAMSALGAAPDAREGITSFLEKRPASFRGRVSSDMPDFYPWWTERQFRGMD
jgi:enoyl-CoA hydratase/carnithine racemase